MWHPHTCTVSQASKADAIAAARVRRDKVAEENTNAGEGVDSGMQSNQDQTAASSTTGRPPPTPASHTSKAFEENSVEDERRNEQAYRFYAESRSSQSISTHGYNVAQYEKLFRADFDASQHRLTAHDIHVRMLRYDQLATFWSAKNVLRRLRGTDSLSAEQQAMLLRAYVRVLNERGHYCKLLTADARTVRVLILQQAENRYNLLQRRKRSAAKEDVGPEFDPKQVELPEMPDKVS